MFYRVKPVFQISKTYAWKITNASLSPPPKKKSLFVLDQVWLSPSPLSLVTQLLNESHLPTEPVNIIKICTEIFFTHDCSHTMEVISMCCCRKCRSNTVDKSQPVGTNLSVLVVLAFVPQMSLQRRSYHIRPKIQEIQQ